MLILFVNFTGDSIFFINQKNFEQLIVIDLKLESLRELSNALGIISLLLFFSFLGYFNISKIILIRGYFSRPRWDDGGEIKKITIIKIDFDLDFFTFFSNEAALD
jgi:hypothetical protein